MAVIWNLLFAWKFVRGLACAACWGVALCAAWCSSARAVGSSVYVNEMLVGTLKSSYSGASPASRASILAGRIAKLSAGASISIGKARDVHHLRANGVLLLAITRTEAKAQQSTTAALARQWAANLSQALALPAIQLEEEYTRVPAGGGRSVALSGTRALKASVQSSDESVVRVERRPGALVVRGVAYGSAAVTISEGDAMRVLRVEVLPLAAAFPQKATSFVTGSPATIDTVKGAIESAIRNELVTASDADIDLLSVQPRNLRMGESATFAARVRVRAPDAFPSEGIVQVVVRNMGLALRMESELWYCNDPENVKGPGPLFWAALRPETPVRLLYHHLNDSPAGMFIEVQLVNEAEVPARVLVIPGDSGPDRNPVQAGIVAAEAMLRLWMNYSGEILTLPPRSSTPLSLRRFGPQETVSGLCSLRLLEGGPESVSVRTDTRPPSYSDPRTAAAIASSTPWRTMGSRLLSSVERSSAAPTAHVYPNPFKTEDVVYRVGGNYGFVRIGQRPISSLDQLRNLDGNFGVFYTINVRVENPTEQPRDIEMVFEASAGYSGALFVVNGDVRRTPLLQAKHEFRVVRLRLVAGETRELSVLTLPLSGSSYPATLTVRPTEHSVPTWQGGAFGVAGT